MNNLKNKTHISDNGDCVSTLKWFVQHVACCVIPSVLCVAYENCCAGHTHTHTHTYKHINLHYPLQLLSLVLVH